MLVHLQTLQWTMLDEGALNPTDNGWEKVALEQSPIMRDISRYLTSAKLVLDYQLTALGYVSSALNTFLGCVHAIDTAANDKARIFILHLQVRTLNIS